MCNYVEESQNKIIENTLNEILPQAFAVIKETARRFTENKKLEVTATDFDHEIAKNWYCSSILLDVYANSCPELSIKPFYGFSIYEFITYSCS